MLKKNVDEELTDKAYMAARVHLFPIDETEEFHDPFSDLSLFLAKKIKHEIGPSPKKWSRSIQSDLLKHILPDFTKRFPKYRLGHAALKKTWDKVLYYLQFIQKQKEALTDEGKLNVQFLIRQNVKTLLHHANTLHPYTSAHNLAVKISECIATIDGERADLEEITKTIWAIQKHLIPKSKTPSPFDRYDQLDKLIVRFQLEEIVEHPDYDPTAIRHAVIKKVDAITHLQKLRSPELISLVLAEELYEEQDADIVAYLEEQLKGAINGVHAVQRALFLYKLAKHLSREETLFNLQTAVTYIQHPFNPAHPALRSEVYAFLDAEIAHLKEQKVERPLEQLLDSLLDGFDAAVSLPFIPEEKLEILAWNILRKQRPLTIPAYVKEALQRELANIAIDHPDDSFRKLVAIAGASLKKLQSMDTSQLEQKAHLWSLQNDMIAKFLHFDETTPFLKLIHRTWKSNPHLTHTAFVDQVLSKLPQTPWHKALKTRIQILYKYVWYNALSEKNETSYDRFLKWHIVNAEQEFPELLLIRLEETTQRLVPLAPFNLKHAQTLFSAVNKVPGESKGDLKSAP